MSSDKFNPFLTPIPDFPPSMPFRDSDAFDLGHPLKSAGLAPGDGDAGITRPHLSRLTQDTASETSLDDEDGGNHGDIDDQEVIIHSVTPKDSLPGVSLRYGIPLAELRRVNQLWTSDSIHLRDVLYIPLQKATRAHPSQDAAAFSSSATIQRIPMSQLSFFPPSRTKARITRRRSLTEQIALASTPPGSFMRTHSLQSTPNLPPFTAPASRRDDIVARLSLDGSRPNCGGGGRDQTETDENHELAIVATAPRNMISRLRPSPRGHLNETTPTRNGSITSSHRSQMAGISIPHAVKHGFVHHARASSPPTSYIPPSSSLSVVRTVQLEPSPIMQIPKRKDTTPGPDHNRKGIEERRDGWTKMPGPLNSLSTRDTMELHDTNKA